MALDCAPYTAFRVGVSHEPGSHVLGGATRPDRSPGHREGRPQTQTYDQAVGHHSNEKRLLRLRIRRQTLP